MAIIYEPKGRAGEYSPLAANLYRGCSHGCRYCYAPAATFTSRDRFILPSIRKNVINQLKKDVVKYKDDRRQILLSFTSDPYQPLEKLSLITRRAIEIMLAGGLRVTVLTKGGMLASRDFDLLSSSPYSEFACTLTTDNNDESIRWEPYAALPAERLQVLKAAHNIGIKTWVSFEPVINPEAVYRLLDSSYKYVDFYKIGKLNYHPLANSINWPEFRRKIISQLDDLNKKYLIKKDLLAAK